MALRETAADDHQGTRPEHAAMAALALERVRGAWRWHAIPLHPAPRTEQMRLLARSSSGRPSVVAKTIRRLAALDGRRSVYLRGAGLSPSGRHRSALRD